ncbi:MAG TPA: hypothetical protein VJ623_14475 [Holophagaceae bacterium]|nr:hypothetical protein [Holophagaceae bacterium]
MLYAAIPFGILALVLFVRSRVAHEWQIDPSEISRVISKLEASRSTPAWAQIIAETRSGVPESAVALDYAITHGQLEFNWCLLAPMNIQDKPQVLEYFSKNGYSALELVAENGCPLIKVSGPNLKSLANGILEDVYQHQGPLTLIGEGFEWP